MKLNLKATESENVVDGIEENGGDRNPKTFHTQETPFNQKEKKATSVNHVVLDFHQAQDVNSSYDSADQKDITIQYEEEEKQLEMHPELFSEKKLRPDFGKLSLKEIDEYYVPSIRSYDSSKKSRRSTNRSQQDLGNTYVQDQEILEKPKANSITEIIMPEDKKQEEEEFNPLATHKSVVSQKSFTSKKSQKSQRSHISLKGSEINLALSKSNSNQQKQVQEDKGGNNFRPFIGRLTQLSI